MNKKNHLKCLRGIKKAVSLQRQNRSGALMTRLDYGVMVTQQILVLFFQVRVLVVQQIKEVHLNFLFLLS